MTDMSPTTATLRFLLILCLAACGTSPEVDQTVTPATTVTASLPEFSDIADVPTLKRTFYGYFHPLVLAENQRIRVQRKRLYTVQHALRDKPPLSPADRSWILQLAEAYELPRNDDAITGVLLDSLLLRVDIVPARLALAQAAIESGWGRSRFARLGNNIFGQWCYSPGCGLVPLKREAGSTHEVAHYDSPALSIRSYVNNLNTHPAYAGWRQLRQRQRDGGDLDAHELARELTAYSSLREEYVQRVRAVMRQNEHLMPQPD